MLTADIQSSQTSAVTNPPPDGNGFPLSLRWSNSWTGTTHYITYNVVGSQLLRTDNISGQTMVLLQNLNSDPAMTFCSSSGGVFSFQITATVGTSGPQSETRSFVVEPRPSP